MCCLLFCTGTLSIGIFFIMGFITWEKHSQIIHSQFWGLKGSWLPEEQNRNSAVTRWLSGIWRFLANLCPTVIQQKNNPYWLWRIGEASVLGTGFWILDDDLLKWHESSNNMRNWERMDLDMRIWNWWQKLLMEAKMIELESRFFFVFNLEIIMRLIPKRTL